MAAMKRACQGAPIEDRLRLHMIEAPSGCWIWLGAANMAGHGRITVDGKCLYAHRVSYETFVGAIPEGLHLDHLCRRPRCINPRHLQPVTAQTNMRRGTSPGARAQRRDICLNGHPYAEFAVIHGVRIKRRQCRACMSMYHRRYAQEVTSAKVTARQKVMADLIAHRDRDLKVSA